ncbi:MAG TPA: patatin-like phospholipase family protein [Streptosporangiaceae bacterium]|nr:patatin-like phospholipase family protein [Streptosporangiaceae bacterium]
MALSRVHLVLSSGGMRALAYIGAVQAFESADIEVASVSACSAGAIVGALVAAGSPGGELERLMLGTDFRRFAVRSPRWAHLVALRRWPFSPNIPTRFADLVGEQIGTETTFGALPKPFATMGIDIVSGEYLVYTKETHPEMRVVEAVRIATAIPLVFPPHQVGDRLIFDAAIATQSPVWLTAAIEPLFEERLPIVVLRSAPTAPVQTPRRLPQFVNSLIAASITGGDNLLIRGNPRVHIINLPTGAVSIFQYDLNPQERARLIRIGRSTTRDAIDRVDGDFAAAQLHVRSAAAYLPGGHHFPGARANDETAAWAGAHYAQQFLTIPPRDVFISYAHKDRQWLDRILQHLQPLVTAGTITIWSDKDIEAGQFWRKELNEAIGRTRVALLLVSPSYLRSDFVAAQEFPALIRAAEERRTVLTWVLLSDATYQAAPVAKLQAAHDVRQPLDTLETDALERALSEIANNIAEAFRTGAPAVRAGMGGSHPLDAK